MDNTKIGTREAITLLATITFNLIVLNISKIIIGYTKSASLLNILYLSILTIFFACLVCNLLNKFPTWDILDISKYLGGNVLKWITGISFIAYFIFFSGVLLNMFATCLQTIYFPLTKLFYIILVFVIGSVIVCNLKNNAVFKSTFIIFPFLVFNIFFIFFANINYFNTMGIYPILGNGFYTTFIGGISNMFAFQGLAYVYFMPPMLKEPNQIKKITVFSIIWSTFFLVLGIATICLMFHSLASADELMPLYSAAKYIEFGPFFRKMDSIIVLIWVISFMSYLGITIKFSINILKKLTYVKNNTFFSLLFGVALFSASIWQKNYAISTFFADIVYKYAFFILIIGISLLILLTSVFKKYVRKWFKLIKT